MTFRDEREAKDEVLRTAPGGKQVEYVTVATKWVGLNEIKIKEMTSFNGRVLVHSSSIWVQIDEFCAGQLHGIVVPQI